MAYLDCAILPSSLPPGQLISHDVSLVHCHFVDSVCVCHPHCRSLYQRTQAIDGATPSSVGPHRWWWWTGEGGAQCGYRTQWYSLWVSYHRYHFSTLCGSQLEANLHVKAFLSIHQMLLSAKCSTVCLLQVWTVLGEGLADGG